MLFNTPYDYDYQSHISPAGDTVSLAVPDLSLSIQTILERFTLSGSLPDTVNLYANQSDVDENDLDMPQIVEDIDIFALRRQRDAEFKAAKAKKLADEQAAAKQKIIDDYIALQAETKPE